MKTEQQITDEFLAELKALLSKYAPAGGYVDITAEDHYMGYPECGEDVRMTVSIPSGYDGNGEKVSEGAEIDLGKYFRS